MARDVAVAFPEVRRTFDRADACLDGSFSQSLSRYIYPPPVFTNEQRDENQRELTGTHVAQPALGATELAYLALLRSFGVEPQMVAGHSYGEFTALAAAGVVDEAHLLRISEARGRFIEMCGDDAGTMAAVHAERTVIDELLDANDVVLANSNAPSQFVVSGSRDSIARAIAWCAERRIGAKELKVACAFHSPLVAPAKERLAEVLAETTLAAPRLPVFSNTTAERYPDEPDEIVALLSEHLARPVEFAREIEAMYQSGAGLFVEVGPGTVLTDLVKRILGDRDHVAVSVDRQGASGVAQLLHCLATLVTEGVDVKIGRLFDGRDVREIDLSGARETKPVRSSQWLVNGGRVRPAGTPLESVEPLELGEAMNRNDEIPERISKPVEAWPQSSGAEQPRVPVVSNGTHAGSMTDGVMAQYHAVMSQFLETERAVMLTLLGQPDIAASQRMSLPAIERNAIDVPLALSAPVANGSNGSNGNGANGASANGERYGASVSPPSEHSSNGNGQQASTAAPEVTQVRHVDVQTVLLNVVAERTGFPIEMLDLDADVEADLGIDSIKRVEIAGTMLEQLSISEQAIDLEELIATRTLRSACAVLQAALPETQEPRADLPL
jgi:acyl transferase domain-containing protein